MLSMSQLRSETLAHLGIDATDLDLTGSANLDLLINRAWWDLLDRVDFKEKDKYTTFSTVAAQRDYSIQTIIGSDIFDAIDVISITDPNSLDHEPLDSITNNWYEENYNEQTTQQAQPTSYFHWNGNLRLYPTPDVIYTINIYYKYILTDLSAGNPAIPQGWHEGILYAAVARGHIRSRDYSSAGFMEGKSNQAMSRKTTAGKDDTNNKFAGVQVYRNKYSVRH